MTLPRTPEPPEFRDSTLIAAYLATRDESILAELELRAIHREARKEKAA